MENKVFGPNVTYFALGIAEGRSAGAFWADKIVFWAWKASRRGLLGEICDKLRIQGRMQILGKSCFLVLNSESTEEL